MFSRPAFPLTDTRSTGRLLLVLGVLLSACGRDSGPPPVSVAVAGIVPPVGLTTLLTARATLPDGSDRDVTAEASWVSLQPQAASVTPEGELKMMHMEPAEVTATFRGVAGSFHVSLEAVVLASRQEARSPCEKYREMSDRLAQVERIPIGGSAVRPALPWTKLISRRRMDLVQQRVDAMDQASFIARLAAKFARRPIPQRQHVPNPYWDEPAIQYMLNPALPADEACRRLAGDNSARASVIRVYRNFLELATSAP